MLYGLDDAQESCVKRESEFRGLYFYQGCLVAILVYNNSASRIGRHVTFVWTEFGDGHGLCYATDRYGKEQQERYEMFHRQFS